MSSENYVNHYVEILTGTMQDAVLKNISLQANAKISEEVISNLQETIEQLTEKDSNVSESYRQQIDELSAKVNQQEGIISDLRNKLVDYDNTKHQVNHVETFRNELARARKELDVIHLEYEAKIKSLNEQIEYLQLTPAKRKKLDEAKAKAEASPIIEVTKDDTTKDGGSF